MDSLFSKLYDIFRTSSNKTESLEVVRESAVNDSSFNLSKAACGKLVAPQSNVVDPSQLKLGKLLGSGGCGLVYSGLYQKSKVAVKVINTKFGASSSNDSIQARFSHPNIVKVIGSYSVPATTSQDGLRRSCSDPSGTTKECQLYVVELCEQGSMEDAIRKGYLVNTQASLCDSLLEVASALNCIHEAGVAHLDVKPGNILLKSAKNSRGYACKLSDFGLAVEMSQKEQVIANIGGTVTHTAPEILSSRKVSAAADVYSFGVVMHELATASLAFDQVSRTQVVFKVCSGTQKWVFPSTVSQSFVELALRCLSTEAASRPTMAEVVSALVAIKASSKKSMFSF